MKSQCSNVPIAFDHVDNTPTLLAARRKYNLALTNIFQCCVNTHDGMHSGPVAKQRRGSSLTLVGQLRRDKLTAQK